MGLGYMKSYLKKTQKPKLEGTAAHTFNPSLLCCLGWQASPLPQPLEEPWTVSGSWTTVQLVAQGSRACLTCSSLASDSQHHWGKKATNYNSKREISEFYIYISPRQKAFSWGSLTSLRLHPTCKHLSKVSLDCSNWNVTQCHLPSYTPYVSILFLGLQ